MQNNISQERKIYLKKIKRNKFAVAFVQIAILVLLISSWEILANMGVIDSFITSQPSRIIKTFMNLSQNGLLEHLYTTTIETVIGFLSGTILGLLIAICLWWSKFLSKVLEPFLVILNSLPKVALGPIIIIWVRSRNASDYHNGISNFACGNYIGNIKWILRDRQRKNKNGKKFWKQSISNSNQNYYSS